MTVPSDVMVVATEFARRAKLDRKLYNGYQCDEMEARDKYDADILLRYMRSTETDYIKTPYGYVVSLTYRERNDCYDCELYRRMAMYLSITSETNIDQPSRDVYDTINRLKPVIESCLDREKADGLHKTREVIECHDQLPLGLHLKNELQRN